MRRAHPSPGARQLPTILTAQSVSTYANQVIALTVPWLILTRTGSAASAGTIAFVMGIASLTGTLAGGVVTDRLGGRRVSMLADTLSLISALALAGALWLDHFSVWFVAVTQVLGVFFDGPGHIAKISILPAAAKHDGLPIARAMGLNQTLQGLATFLGPITAGLLIASLGVPGTLSIAAALFSVGIGLAFLLPRQAPRHDVPLSVRQAYQEMRDAVRFLVHEPFLGRMQIVGPTMGAVIVPISALVLPAWFVFGHQSSRELGVFLGAGAVGGMIGGILFAAAAERLRQRTWLVGATFLYAAGIGSLYLVEPGSTLAIAIALLAGLMLSVLFAVPYTAFYSRTPQALLGRVGSLGAAQGALFGALSSLGFGWLLQTASAPSALLVCAFLMAAIGVALATMPFLRLLDQAPAAPRKDGVMPPADTPAPETTPA